MAALDQKILETLEKTIPQLSFLDKEKLLAFGEGLAFHANPMRRDCSGCVEETIAEGVKTRSSRTACERRCHHLATTVSCRFREVWE